jgi:hypothetical protein
MELASLFYFYVLLRTQLFLRFASPLFMIFQKGSQRSIVGWVRLSERGNGQYVDYSVSRSIQYIGPRARAFEGCARAKSHARVQNQYLYKRTVIVIVGSDEVRVQ